MFRQALLASLLAISPVSAARCEDAIPILPPKNFTPEPDYPPTAPPPTTPLYVHVVAGSKDRKDGYLTEKEVLDQVDIITTHFQPHGITFHHDASMRQWIVNASWAGGSLDFNEMKESLHKGDYRAVNLYIRNITVADYGGTCTNPWSQEERWSVPFPRRLDRDGCVINVQTLAGSSHAFMNMGKTAVHEIGHWFGLFHTYEAGTVRDGLNPPNPCWAGNPGDEVKDTPRCREVSPAGQCNATQNTCPEPAGQPVVYDAVWNIMSESSDGCYKDFTEGQRERMYFIYDKYRRNETRG
ncbi:extracellular metalloprotease 1 [Podospora aff. communis PSN243]|uniref:Extracellular metalloprotease 1 n=1 Tax=Podospora aff. communis PSN243 TaxID=3040156 RepID=A0AAV9GSD7_9PEZI|nr:extracellular metalloprotease 1 [Podospora aff. communis PSN243]